MWSIKNHTCAVKSSSVKICLSDKLETFRSQPQPTLMWWNPHALLINLVQWDTVNLLQDCVGCRVENISLHNWTWVRFQANWTWTTNKDVHSIKDIWWMLEIYTLSAMQKVGQLFLSHQKRWHLTWLEAMSFSQKGWIGGWIRSTTLSRHCRLKWEQSCEATGYCTGIAEVQTGQIFRNNWFYTSSFRTNDTQNNLKKRISNHNISVVWWSNKVLQSIRYVMPWRLRLCLHRTIPV